MSRFEQKIEHTDSQAMEVLSSFVGSFSTTDAQKLGVHTRVLYRLRDEGAVEELARGVYRVGTTGDHHDLVVAGAKAKQAVICLISALSFHDLTTQIPKEVNMALPKGVKKPKLNYPPIKCHWFSEDAYSEGIEIHEISGIKVKIYCVEKTLADCFKFRNQIGMDVVIEALKMYRSRKRPNYQKLMKYAKICRVEKIMRPYLEVSM